MKKFFLLAGLSLIISVSFSQTLFTYAAKAVSKDEFLKAFNKNNTLAANKNAALREYLDLYINFKLKVKAAQDMHLDTSASINTDINNFRTQIEDNYLNDEKEVNVLTDEAFERSQKDIHIAHLFIPLDKQGTDTIRISKGIQDAWNALIKNVSFEDVVQQLKTKSITASWADAGFITVFSLPYEFENIVYQLRPGQVSKAYRSKNGYHFFKNIEEREAAGKIRIAQILIAVPANADYNQKNTALKVADSVYKALRAGADFSATAKAISNDKNTFETGGIMPEFSTGSYDPVFESKAFALNKPDQITVPFQTSYGYHILKKIGNTVVPKDKNNAEYISLLKQQVRQDLRITSAREKFLNEILKKLGYKKNMSINQIALWRVTDSFELSNKKTNSVVLNEKTLLYSFDNSKVTVGDWLKYVKDYKHNSAYKGESNDDLMKKFISAEAFKLYRKRLEQYDADFKYQLQEFKEGNMLFEIMERNVWSKASTDSAGLVKYYNDNKTKYYWKESADVVLISGANEKVARLAANQLRSSKNWHQLTEDSSLQVQADSGRYELYQVPVKLNSKITPETVTEPLLNAADGTASFVKVIRVYAPHQSRTFEQARGLVINDYQNLLEEKWLQQLKKKFPVKVNEKVFKSLLN